MKVGVIFIFLFLCSNIIAQTQSIQPNLSNPALELGRNNGYPTIKALASGSGNIVMDAYSDGDAIYLNHYISANTLLSTGGGNVGIGTTIPRASLHLLSNAIQVNSTRQYDSNLIIEATSTSRSTSEGAAIGFVVPAAQNGGNPWQQGRILVTPDNTSNSNAHGRMYLQTRYNEGGVWQWRDNLVLKSNGNVGVGTSIPDEKLTVKGKIHSEEVRVDLAVPAPDYVFEKEYDLRGLDELETYIEANKHLPEIPSANDFKDKGILVGDMNMLLLKKVEELTLYIISQHKEIQQLKREVRNSANQSDK
ncbi:hypothetical protein DSM03_11715 [Leeuwenhoekiella aestuarii]|uniref:tail fiber protein n=1 Tax=Leeuwenhoekiella aestuarii TaxID=2249426 RepID=UPI000FFE7793|nr:tail fiber protein [Leeuwenhoekiella aestuarii]RXG11378.1 hypothetical protein DSM03_11715 [Leeuwenhoekiella aestuarii]